jgi:hypothetical protein
LFGRSIRLELPFAEQRSPGPETVQQNFTPAAARLGGPDINEILKRQNEELMKDIASRTAGPDINEFLNNQKTGRLLPDVESANDGSQGEEAGTPRPSRAESRSGRQQTSSPAPIPGTLPGGIAMSACSPVSTDQASAASA